MRTKERITKNFCDKNSTTLDADSSKNIINMTITDEKRTNSCSRSTAMNTTETGTATPTQTTKATNEHLNREIISGGRLLLMKTESFVINYNNNDKEENAYTKESERCGEKSDELPYDIEKTKENQDDKETINNCDEEMCLLSKMYLKDIAVDSQELVNAAEKANRIPIERSRNLPVAFGVILSFIFPLANGVVHGIKGIRGAKLLKVIRCMAYSRQTLTNLFSYTANKMSLNFFSLQVLHRIEAVLKLLKLRKPRVGIEYPSKPSVERHGAETLTQPSSASSTSAKLSTLYWEPRFSLPNLRFPEKKLFIEEHEATKCCTLNVLAEPPEGQPIRADIVFIHGLNGSLTNTWRQGMWENERRPVAFQRPPKPPVRPPKRQRHSRTNPLHPPHHKKRARFSHTDIHQTYSHEGGSIDETDENRYSFVCSEIKDFQLSDGLNYSFPTFRLRLHENSRLLQAECDSNLENANKEQNNKDSPKVVSSYSKCWPGDWLPLDCPGVRVIALNYTTDQHLWRPLWKKKEARSNLTQRSKEMIELLIQHRVGYGHPIIWVGHSKGGLFIKQIIVDAWESGRPAAAPLWRSARGVFFYSVPHRGSHLASIKPPFVLRSVELIDIEKNNKHLLDLHGRFAGLYHLGHLKIEIFSFVETAFTLMSVFYMRIVGVDSGDPGIGDVCGIRLDHREICKPRSRDCILYKQLVNMINKVC